MLELALKGKNLLLKPVIERLELLCSGTIGVCGTQGGSVVALTELRRGRESHGVVGRCGEFVFAFFFVGKVVVFEVGVEANRRQVRCDVVPQSVHCLRIRAKRGSHVNQRSREHLRFVNGPREREREFNGNLQGNFETG